MEDETSGNVARMGGRGVRSLKGRGHAEDVGGRIAVK
jgi:hypothetical protein